MNNTKALDATNIPNGQLMHLAAEVVKKAMESSQHVDQEIDFSRINDITLPPVCAL